MISSSELPGFVSANIPHDDFLECPTGLVEYYFADGIFRWSDSLYRMYGYERGEVVPSMDMAMAHIEPADRPRVQAYWERVSSAGGPSSIYVSIRDRKDRQHKLLYSADFILEGDTAVGVWGVVVDLTQSIHTDRHQLATEAVAASAVNRAVIEQAKGILMGRTGVNAEQAFELISQLSQDTNRKVHAIAQEIVERATAQDGDTKDQPLL
ncbi:PAS and ANTAR domain-containing protein [Pseudarthrobacter sp. BRE9]|uniref:PAS and ANTAR domain-containing protein n=1 Tax=Pseudarthrobacter sp. BRE9 TaxID=2962582 RepID=UPI002882BF40|nr:PAS and ANTAR domain-containing protein [Pseudarthrobacter sp. BRE9]MDT0169261.1 PAS and ANTAR domain-containing protein [Pseudarthrobacter sp. BRE9]